VSAKLRGDTQFTPQPVTHAISLLEHGEENALRNRNVGIYFGIGKLFYDIFRKISSETLPSGIHGAVLFLSTSQGPVNFAHGGAIAHVMDDCCGLAFGAACFTLSLSVMYKKAVPLLETLCVKAHVTKLEQGTRVQNIYVAAP
jgi:hypothetical protein